ncbi:MAG: protein phosphatase 2C domain-containing protein [Gemmatimonadota bacterium]
MTSFSACIVVGGSDRGRRRARNEDSFVLLPEDGIAVVADGMGGHPGGDVASRIAARATADGLRQKLSSTANATLEDRERAMRASVLEAHEAVLARSREEPSLLGMGTTTTAIALDITTGRYIVGNIGDSRTYRFRDGRLEQLTRDDTWLQDRIDSGRIRREDAMGHPEGHLLTQCIGLDQTPVPRTVQGEAAPGDVFLLCSDGLMASLTDDDIVDVLERSLDGTAAGAERTVEALIGAANAAGGRDNITVALVAVP